MLIHPPISLQNDTHFHERQKFNVWLVWLILGAVEITRVIAMYLQLVAGRNFREHPGSLIGFLILQLVIIFLLVLRIDTAVKDDGIYVRFFPIHLSYKFFAWESIEKAYVRKYSPILEYGGWGIKYGIARPGKVYNLSGNKGLQIEFADGNQLLIGTQKPDELAHVLQDMGKLQSQPA